MVIDFAQQGSDGVERKRGVRKREKRVMKETRNLQPTGESGGARQKWVGEWREKTQQSRAKARVEAPEEGAKSQTAATRGGAKALDGPSRASSEEGREGGVELLRHL